MCAVFKVWVKYVLNEIKYRLPPVIAIPCNVRGEEIGLNALAFPYTNALLLYQGLRAHIWLPRRVSLRWIKRHSPQLTKRSSGFKFSDLQRCQLEKIIFPGVSTDRKYKEIAGNLLRWRFLRFHKEFQKTEFSVWGIFDRVNSGWILIVDISILEGRKIVKLFQYYFWWFCWKIEDSKIYRDFFFFFIVKSRSSLSTFVFIFSAISQIIKKKFYVFWTFENFGWHILFSLHEVILEICIWYRNIKCLRQCINWTTWDR